MENGEWSKLQQKLPKNSNLTEQDISSLLPLYEKYKHLEGKKVIVMFSGGLDTSFISHFLQHVIGAEVTTVTVDIGSVTAPANMQEVAERSKTLKVAHHLAFDKLDQLAELGIQALQAGAKLGQEGHHPASSLSRVAICDGVVEVAKREGIVAVFHGSNGSQNNPYRFNSGLAFYKDKYAYPELEECTPNLRNDVSSADMRDVQKHYLEAMGVPSKSQEFEKNVSHDRNMLGDEWEEACVAHTDQRFDLRKEGLRNLPLNDSTLHIGIRFKDGRPVALKLGESEWSGITPTDLFRVLNKEGLERRIGIVDHPEKRPIGINAREIHIAPAMHILHKAHDHLRGYCLDRDEVTELNQLSLKWSHWVMEKNLYTHPLVRTMNTTFRAYDKGLDGDVFLDLEQEKVTNITSEAAKETMEGTKAPVTEKGIGEYTAKAIHDYNLIPDAYADQISQGASDAVARVKAMQMTGVNPRRILLKNTLRRVGDADAVLGI